MALANAIQGAKRPSQLITWTEADGTTAFDLSGATITARISDRNMSNPIASDGIFTITDATAGKYRWDYGDLDIATAGNYKIQFTATFSSGKTPAKTIIEDFIVLRSI